MKRLSLGLEAHTYSIYIIHIQIIVQLKRILSGDPNIPVTHSIALTFNHSITANIFALDGLDMKENKLIQPCVTLEQLHILTERRTVEQLRFTNATT